MAEQDEGRPERTAVLGTAEFGGDSYRFDLSAGESATVATSAPNAVSTRAVFRIVLLKITPR